MGVKIVALRSPVPSDLSTFCPHCLHKFISCRFAYIGNCLESLTASLEKLTSRIGNTGEYQNDFLFESKNTEIQGMNQSNRTDNLKLSMGNVSTRLHQTELTVPRTSLVTATEQRSFHNNNTFQNITFVLGNSPCVCSPSLIFVNSTMFAEREPAIRLSNLIITKKCCLTKVNQPTQYSRIFFATQTNALFVLTRRITKHHASDTIKIPPRLSNVKIDSTTTNGKITTQYRRYPRNCCIIFHNLPESKSSLLTERITYYRTLILEHLHQLIKGKLLNISFKLVKVLRLRRRESPTSVKPRLMKTVFEYSEQALMILHFRFGPYTNDIKIYPDLSPKDVLRHRAARYELAKRRAQFTNHQEVTSNDAVTSTTSNDYESNELCAHQYHLDILLIVETWISSSSVNSAHIPGYYIFSAHRTNKFGGGVATYVNSNASLNPALLESFVSKDLEILVVKLSKNNGRRIFCLVIINVYRHPIGCKETALQILTSLLRRLQEKHKHILMSGDLNMLDLYIVTC
ncbi:hypothetical protein GJ496_001094 [Pomphorhynchus laevis]|nr:hypothetical protein GJ496_001094 [Pomphorhynchus laevis]